MSITIGIDLTNHIFPNCFVIFRALTEDISDLLSLNCTFLVFIEEIKSFLQIILVDKFSLIDSSWAPLVEINATSAFSVYVIEDLNSSLLSLLLVLISK